MDQEMDSLKSVQNSVWYCLLFPGILHLFCFCDCFVFTVLSSYLKSCLL